MHAAGLPKVAEVFDQTAVSYPEPDPNASDRVKVRRLKMSEP
jgi:hypothetical protein